MNKTKKFIAYSLILFLWIFLLEAISFTTLYVIQNKYNSLYFDYSKINIKPDLSNQNYSEKLGWISPQKNLDEFGARIDDGSYKSSCIDMFGDSFTFSLDVSDNEAWPKKLGVLLNCRVYNYGVSAYGSDQATMRHGFMKPSSKVAVLNHLSENIIRNVNQSRNFIYPSGELRLKPRYDLDNSNQLNYIPIPNIELENLNSIEYLNKNLLNDYFIPEGLSGIRMIENFSLPYSFELLRMVSNHWHVKSKIGQYPRHMPFYDFNHPSNGLKITVEIFKKFINQANYNNQYPIITIIPTCLDLEYINKKKRLPYQPLIDELLKNDIIFFDFSRTFLNTDNFYDFFVNCNGHPNASGYELMAKSFKDFINNDIYLLNNKN